MARESRQRNRATAFLDEASVWEDFGRELRRASSAFDESRARFVILRTRFANRAQFVWKPAECSPMTRPAEEEARLLSNNRR